MKEDIEIQKNYDSRWKEIIENSDGSINLEQLKRELSDFSMLIDFLSKFNSYISGGIVSYPQTKPEAVLALYEEELEERYNEGYQDALNDMKEPKESMK